MLLSNPKTVRNHILNTSFRSLRAKINGKLAKGINNSHNFNRYYFILFKLLINKFPYIKYPPSCNFLSDINTLVNNKKNIMAE
jgi:hypothetical protein